VVVLTMTREPTLSKLFDASGDSPIMQAARAVAAGQTVDSPPRDPPPFVPFVNGVSRARAPLVARYGYATTASAPRWYERDVPIGGEVGNLLLGEIIMAARTGESIAVYVATDAQAEALRADARRVLAALGLVYDRISIEPPPGPNDVCAECRAPARGYCGHRGAWCRHHAELHRNRP
jgi:hypothetical protein